MLIIQDEGTPSYSPFAEFGGVQLHNILEQADSGRTKSTSKWGVNVFKGKHIENITMFISGRKSKISHIWTFVDYFLGGIVNATLGQSLRLYGTKEGKGRRLWETVHQILFANYSRDNAIYPPATWCFPPVFAA